MSDESRTTVSLTESTRAYLERRGADDALKRFNAWVAETDRQLSALAKCAMSNEQTTVEQKLAWFFREAWKVFVDGGSIDGFELQEMLENSGLTEWRECSAEEASRFDCDIEAGEPALFLNEEGKRVNAMGREIEARNV